eukprot:CAMPEP_0172502070 /NCGR_PEP_ID=MMETSP1066-20121228/156121_1 /TAXON_ID=671091 /ORGANISM="Coscinodiscus wailesii, Strain CCMP2513" /LENGTH=343 /DNA_ID=CAMNT_0013277175 /DNA_START=58 /DNA_END=1086 /DNA_ORIENTATION=+
MIPMPSQSTTKAASSRQQRHRRRRPLHTKNYNRHVTTIPLLLLLFFVFLPIVMPFTASSASFLVGGGTSVTSLVLVRRAALAFHRRYHHHPRSCDFRYSFFPPPTTTTAQYPPRPRPALTTRRLAAAAQSSSSSSSSSSPSQILPIKSNNDIVSERLQSQREKKIVRQRYRHEKHLRNLELKRQFHSGGGNNNSRNGTAVVGDSLFAVKVSVCPTLRRELNLNGREKRGRVFIDRLDDEGNATTTIKGLTTRVHEFFRALRRSSFVLSGSLPQVAEDGTLIPYSTENPQNYTFHPLRNDDDVSSLFTLSLHSNNRTASSSTALARPTVLLHVSKDPDAPPPPP